MFSKYSIINNQIFFITQSEYETFSISSNYSYKIFNMLGYQLNSVSYDNIPIHNDSSLIDTNLMNLPINNSNNLFYITQLLKIPFLALKINDFSLYIDFNFYNFLFQNLDFFEYFIFFYNDSFYNISNNYDLSSINSRILYSFSTYNCAPITILHLYDNNIENILKSLFNYISLLKNPFDSNILSKIKSCVPNNSSISSFIIWNIIPMLSISLPFITDQLLIDTFNQTLKFIKLNYSSNSLKL
jgi:hypothetical protein